MRNTPKISGPAVYDRNPVIRLKMVSGFSAFSIRLLSVIYIATANPANIPNEMDHRTLSSYNLIIG